MPLLSPSEKSALELMLRNKLGSGAGTTALLKLLANVDTSIDVVIPEELADEVKALVIGEGPEVASEPAPEIVVTESSP